MNFQIDYILVNATGSQIKEGTFNVKNQDSEFAALAGLQKHLLKLHPTATKMLAKKVKIETMLGYVDNSNPLSAFFAQK